MDEESSGIDGRTDNSENTEGHTPAQFRTSNGIVYGYTKNGKIYLNAERLNPNTPIHEYTHLWDKEKGLTRLSSAPLYVRQEIDKKDIDENTKLLKEQGKRAIKEDGQLLILTSKEAAEGLSTLPDSSLFRLDRQTANQSR